MRTATAIIGLSVAGAGAFLGVCGGVAFHRQIANALGFGSHFPAMVSSATQPATTGPGETGKKARKILYWEDSMYNPPYISDKPGKSPMGMELTPVYADEANGGGGGGSADGAVTIDPVVVQNMGVRTAKVEKGPLDVELRVVGTLQEPEQNHVVISLRVNGWIQKLYADQDGMQVRKGEPLFELYSPELTAAADELIAAKNGVGGEVTDPVAKGAAEAVVAAARRKLELLGVSESDIDAISKRKTAPQTVTFRSPISGHLVNKKVVEGSAVKAGDSLMEISDRSTMWLMLQVYEHDLPLVKKGTPVVATFTALPGKKVTGVVDYVYPILDAATRTATVRVVLPNKNHLLHENMYATATVEAQVAKEALMVPREAIIDSGMRQIVFVAEGAGHFAPREVTVGATGRGEKGETYQDESVQILAGLTGKETVVTSGQFLLDSESRLQEAIEKQQMQRKAAGGGDATAQGPATTPGSAAAPMDGRVDPVIKAYLAVEAALTGPAAKGAEVGPLVKAAKELADQKGEENVKKAAGEIAGAAEKMSGKPLKEQREGLAKVSAGMVQLLDAKGPTSAVGPAIYQFHCPMTKKDWVQASEKPANPYLPDMPDCATLTRKVTTAQAQEGGA